MNVVVLVHGTWGRHTSWHRPGSPLWRALEERGFAPVEFSWSGYCGGVPGPVIVPSDQVDFPGALELWRCAGEKLWYFLRVLGLDAPNVISHSHGVQVVVFAACAGQTFHRAVSLSGPVRADMRDFRQQARQRIDRLTQVYDPATDAVIREGEAFDGELGWHYTLPEADANVAVPGQGHSGMTVDVAAWERLGLWDHLLADDPPELATGSGARPCTQET